MPDHQIIEPVAIYIACRGLGPAAGMIHVDPTQLEAVGAV
jgi:hypothetical protein